LRRADDVREEHRREHAVELPHRAHAGQELLDLVGDGVKITCPEDEVIARQFDPASTRDVLREVATVLNADHAVAAAVHHEGGNGDAGKYRPDIDGF
jgi:hypothetical protein